MNLAERDRVDRLVEAAIEALPVAIRSLLDEVPLIVDDEPTDEILESLGLDPGDPALREELCGLHTGDALTEQSVEDSGRLPTDIHLFRVGIVILAGGWDGADADARVGEEIRITLLHEIGHHFGLEEDDLADLGYD
jgi:predicted Zn-dependent protease with MMP-like domain